MAAAIMHFPIPNCNFGKIVPHKARNINALKPLQSVRCTKLSDSPTIIRRSGNYQPCIWDNNFLRSLKSDYRGESFNGRADKLKADVVMMLNTVAKPLDQLELIDDLQRLGLAYHFEEYIDRALEKIYNDHTNFKWEKDLDATALEFRLLRQHGYHIPQEVFKRFMDNGSFKECLRADGKGMLSLYESSYFALEGECLMEEAWCFTSKILKELDRNVDSNIATQVKQALELPVHWRMSRLEARWYIDVYERSKNMVPVLLELAKLDFQHRTTITQGRSQKWVEVVGKISLITVIDDIYDVYGTLEELELFTDAIVWDINAIKQLPDYMKICFLALYNFVNEIVYDILKEQDLDVLPHLKKAWVDLVKSYLVEARWYASGYKPTLGEYMSNGWVSITGPLIAVQAYIFSTKPIKKEALEFLEDKPDILYLSSVIFRLSDDYGTSTDELKRGDVPKSIQCYMSETGVCEEVAREHMRGLMRTNWKEVNKYRVADSPLDRSFVENMLNLVRTAHCMYNDGDGHGVEDGVTRGRVFSLLVKSIPP